METESINVNETNTDLGFSPDQCYLFIDKYKPKSFDDIKFNHDIASKMKACSKSHELPHIIIKGPGGCGKNTFADLFVQTKYGKDQLVVKHQTLEIKHASKPIALQVLYSNFHYKLDPSAHGVYDKTIISGFIKDVIQTKPIGLSLSPYHTIIIENADHLTLEAQQSLRRTLEKYIENCRIVFIIAQESNLIGPLMSRCVQLRLSAPTYDEVTQILTDICDQEHIDYIPEQLIQISHYSRRNLNSAINLLQSLSMSQPEILSKAQVINFKEYVEIASCLDQIMDLLFNKRNLKTILAVRNLLQDLLVHCVEPIVVLKDLFLLIFNRVDDSSRHLVINALNRYENSLKQGSKPIYHLEGFIVSIINILDGVKEMPPNLF